MSNQINWIPLDSIEKIEKIKAQSDRPIAIFKHSTTCGISNYVKDTFENEWDINHSSIDLYYLDLLRYRPVSNQVASEFGVHHQSPQIIVVKNGKAVYDTSHSSIKVSSLKKVLEKIRD